MKIWANKTENENATLKHCRKIVIIELDLDIHKIHLHTKPNFNLMLRSQIIIWKPKIMQFYSIKRGVTGKNCRKIVIIKLNLDINKIHLLTTPSFNLIFHSQVIIWKPQI